MKSIETSEWFINSGPLDLDKELIAWIKSINKDFRTRIKYKPFELYKKQAEQWANDPIKLVDLRETDEQEWWLRREHKRCKDNTLYFANTYGKLKDEFTEKGEIDYEAWEAQAITLHLLDRGYSAMIGKGRQIGFTSTMGLFAVKKVNFNKNFFTKFVTHSYEKGVEIFNDKIKWPFGKLPDFIRHHVYNDRDNFLSLKDKEEKGKTSGMGSAIKVETPAVDAINGGSPGLVLIDEIGLFNMFGMIMREGRPTMFRWNPQTNKLEMKRQFVGWGTGGQMGQGATAFEEEFYAAVNSFNEGKHDYGIIPLFFNAFARGGMTQEFYETEKAKAYSIPGREGEMARVQFHQAFPMTIEDMFLRTSKTLIPVSMCNEKIEKIYMLDPKPAPGYFEPKYNHDGRIIDCEFIPLPDFSNDKISCTIIKHPKKGWSDRNFQGTDPVNSESGHSKMGSAIWDKVDRGVSAYMNFRDIDLKWTFTQNLCLGLYYGKPNAPCMELLEANSGDFYKDFKTEMGYERSLTAQKMLPEFLQINTLKWWGINNKTQTAGKIITKLTEMIDVYGDNIHAMPFWVQLKTFVEKSLVPKSGTMQQQTQRLSRYQAADLSRDYDDIIFAITFAYINSLAHDRIDPKEDAREGGGEKLQLRYVMNAQTGYAQRLAYVNSKGKIVRFYNQRGGK